MVKKELRNVFTKFWDKTQGKEIMELCTEYGLNSNLYEGKLPSCHYGFTEFGCNINYWHRLPNNAKVVDPYEFEQMIINAYKEKNYELW